MNNNYLAPIKEWAKGAKQYIEISGQMKLFGTSDKNDKDKGDKNNQNNPSNISSFSSK